jgi:hypothetical protein
LGVSTTCHAVVAGNADPLAARDRVVAREVGNLFRQHARKRALVDALLHLHGLAFRQIATHGIARTHDFPRHAVQHFHPLDIAAGTGYPVDARSLGTVALLIDEGTGVRKLLSRLIDLAQQPQRLGRILCRRLCFANAAERQREADGAQHHFLDPRASLDTVRT